MKYEILEVNKKDRWVRIKVTFDDKTTYEKRMMAPMDSEETIHGAIRQWLADYLPLREAESKFDPEKLKSKSVTLTTEDLPKTTIEQDAEKEAKAKKERVTR